MPGKLTKKKAKRKSPEADLQRAVVELLATYERQGHLRYFAVPNGGSRHPAEAVNLKRQGVRAGVPDIIVLHRDGTVSCLELKSRKGVTTPEQDDWLAWLRTVARHTTAVIRDADEVPYVLGFKQRRAA